MELRDAVPADFDAVLAQRFHARLGFHEVGTQRVAGGRKRVSLQAAQVP